MYRTKLVCYITVFLSSGNLCKLSFTLSGHETALLNIILLYIQYREWDQVSWKIKYPKLLTICWDFRTRRIPWWEVELHRYLVSYGNMLVAYFDHQMKWNKTYYTARVKREKKWKFKLWSKGGDDTGLHTFLLFMLMYLHILMFRLLIDLYYWAFYV